MFKARAFRLLVVVFSTVSLLMLDLSVVAPRPAAAAKVSDLPPLSSGPAPQQVTQTDAAPAVDAPAPPMVSGSKDWPPAPPKSAKGFDASRSVRLDAETTPTAEVFANPDGSRTAKLSVQPVRFKDATGAWRDIDSSLTSDGTGGFRPVSSPSPISIPADALVGTAVVPTAAGALTVGAPDAAGSLGAPSLIGGEVEFAPGSGSGPKVRVSIATSGVNQSLVLSSGSGPSSYQVPFRVPAGVSARNGGTGVEFVDGSGVVVAEFGGGLAYDSAKVPSRTSVSSRLVGQFGGVAVAQVSIDPAWLADAGRVAPIVIDPTTITPTTATGWDTWVQDNISSSQWSSDHLEAGVFADGHERRALLSFDMSTFTADQILSATLKVYNRASATCNPTNMDLHEVLSGWDSSTVWTNQPPVSAGYYDRQTFGLGPATSCPGAPGWVSFNAAAIVADWKLGGVANNGMELIGGGGLDGKNFWSGDYVDHSAAPALQITYNRKPTVPQMASPVKDGVVTSVTPTLVTNPSTDPDGDPIYYYFRVATGLDGESGSVVANSGWTTSTSWQVPSGALSDGGVYYWHVWALDILWSVTLPATAIKFSVNLRLGSSGPSPMDAVGPVKVNLATGNVVVETASPKYASVGGGVGLSYTYNSMMPSDRGLTGAYFNSGDLSGVVALQRRDQSVNMDWGLGSPGQGVNVDNFSARWTGYVTLPVGSGWQLGATSDDGVRIYVDDMSTPVLDRWSSPPFGSVAYGSSTFTGTGTQRRAIKIEYRDVSGAAYVHLYAKNASTEQIVPPDWLSIGAAALPAGWAMSADLDGSVHYVQVRVNGSSAAFMSADGRVSTYTWTGSGWAPPAEEDGVVTGAPGGALTLADTDGQEYTFNADGTLASVTTAADDTKPAALKYTWSGTPARLTQITDPVSNRSVTLTYKTPTSSCPAGPSGFDAQPPDQMLCQVTYWDTDTTSLYYSGGQLARIQDPPVDPAASPVRYELTDFGYDSAGRIAKVRDPLAADAIQYGVSGVPDDDTTRTLVTYVASGAYAGRVDTVTGPAPSAGTARPGHSYAHTCCPFGIGLTDVHVAGMTGTNEPNGYARRVVYDSLDRSVYDTDATAKTTTTTWDTAADRVLAVTDPAGLETVTNYDTRNRPYQTIGPAPSTWFDANRNLVAPHSSAAGSGDTPSHQTSYDEGVTGLASTFYPNTQLTPGTNPAQPSQVHTTGVGETSGALLASWGTTAPASITTGDNWSARYTGDITLPATGTYTFKSFTGDNEGGRLYLDDKEVIGNWNSLSTPDAVSWGTNRIDVVARGTDDALAHRWWAGGAWAVESLGGILTSDPAITSRGSGLLDAFGRGTDNQLWQTYYTPTGGWSNWLPLGGVLTSGPSAAVNGNNLYVFALGTGNVLYENYWNGTAWSGWLAVPGSLGLTSDPAVTVGGGAVHVFAKGSAGQLIHRWFDTGWHEEDLGGTLTSKPDAVTSNPGVISVFARNSQNHLQHKYWNQTAWSGWVDLGGTLSTGAGASSWGDGRIDTFVNGTDDVLYTKWLDPVSGLWSAWTAVATNERVGALAVTDVSKPHRIRYETNKTTGTANLDLHWIPPGGGEATIPGSALNARYGLPTSHTDPDGNRASSTYQNLEYPNTAVALPTGSTLDPSGLALATTAGYETAGGTNHFFRRTSRTLPAGNAWTYKYYAADTNPTTASSTCAGSNVDQGGALWERTGPDPTTGAATGRVEEFAYDQAGRTVGARVNTETWTCTVYDHRGRPTTRSIPAYGAEPARTVTYNYAVGNNPLVTSESDAAGTVTTTTDLLGRTTSYADAWGQTTTTTYDQAERVSQVTTPLDTFTYDYDPAGRVLNVRLAGNIVASPFYDTAGRLDHVSYPTGAGNTGNGTSLAPIVRDALGRSTGLTWNNPSGTPITSDTVTRKLSDRVREESIDGVDPYPAGDNFAYDAAGRLTAANVPGHNYTYAFASTNTCGTLTTAGKNTNRTAMTDNAGPATTYCYDQADKLTSTTTAGLSALAYDAHGNTTTLGAETLGYDGADRHVTSSANGTSLRYGRDATDRIVSRVATSPTPITLRADAAATNGTGGTSLTLTRPAGTQTNDVLIAQVTVAGATTVTPPSGWTAIATATNGTAVRTATYSHVAATGDPATWTFTLGASQPAAGGITAYTGVDTTNPIDQTATATTTATTAHTLPSVTTTAWSGLHLGVVGLTTATSVTPAPGASERHDLSSAGTTPVTAELADTPLTAPGATGAGTATSAVAASSATQTITLRPATSTDVQIYVFTGPGDTPDITTGVFFSNPERQIPLPGGVLLTKRASGTDTWSYPNLHGDITATADGTGLKLGATATYDPYGNPLGALPDNSAGNYDYGWLGQHQRGLEHAPGLQAIIEMGARQYHPALGRFLETDPIEGGTPSDYTYVADPINQFDLNGMGCGWNPVCHVKHEWHRAQNAWRTYSRARAYIQRIGWSFFRGFVKGAVQASPGWYARTWIAAAGGYLGCALRGHNMGMGCALRAYHSAHVNPLANNFAGLWALWQGYRSARHAHIRW